MQCMHGFHIDITIEAETIIRKYYSTSSSYSVTSPSNSVTLYKRLTSGPGQSVEQQIGDDIVCHLTDDDPNMPSLQQMHQLIAQSPRAQAKFFFLMDDIADIYFMGMDQSFIGRHHVQQTFHHKHRED